MILEGIVTTANHDGTINVAAMGACIQDVNLENFDLRPFQTSRTFENLRRTNQGVLHVTDDVELLVYAALDRESLSVELQPAQQVDGQVMSAACRWYEFRVLGSDLSHPRANFVCRTICAGRGRDFLGFNRAKHAVIEACILATRLQFLPVGHVQEQLDQLSRLVDKTGGPPEHAAFEFVRQHVAGRLQNQS